MILRLRSGSTGGELKMVAKRGKAFVWGAYGQLEGFRYLVEITPLLTGYGFKSVNILLNHGRAGPALHSIIQARDSFPF